MAETGRPDHLLAGALHHSPVPAPQLLAILQRVSGFELFLPDIFPTGYMAAEQCNIKTNDVIAVWGCGPVR